VAEGGGPRASLPWVEAMIWIPRSRCRRFAELSWWWVCRLPGACLPGSPPDVLAWAPCCKLGWIRIDLPPLFWRPSAGL